MCANNWFSHSFHNLIPAITQSTNVLVILLLALRLTLPVVGMVDLTHEMLTARTLDEFRAAEDAALREPKKDNLRRHALAEELPDSQHILADKFGNEPGFYHGVASGE
jgi:hypothetical protein